MRLVAMLGLVLLAACGGPTQTPTSQIPTPTAELRDPTAIPTAEPAGSEITLWVAPQFAPETGLAAGVLLAERIQSFIAQNPGVQISVRTKAEKGPASLIESLAAASRGAPSALADLITLDSQGIRSVTQAGLVQPISDFDALSTYYGFATESVLVDNVAYGRPFASEMEAFAYETAEYDSAPIDLKDLSESSTLIAGSDPSATFVLAQYLSAGGQIGPDLELDANLLAEVLGQIVSAQDARAISPISLNLSSSEETWLALLEERGGSAQAPYEAFVHTYHPDIHGAGPIPTANGLGIGLGAAWSWALIGDEISAEASRLLDWLSEPGFEAQWTHALGLLPARPSVMTLWPDSPEASIGSRLVAVAVPLPSLETLDAIGPPLGQALLAVLLGESSPAIAAAEAVQEISDR